MEEWKEYRIEETSIEMIDGDRGKNYPKNNDFFTEGYCLFLNAGNVTKTGFSFSDNSFITRDKDNALRKGRLERADVVITTRGTVGNVALYDMNVPFEHIRINSGMLILKSGKDILPEYLYYYLKGNTFQTQISQYVSGSAQPQLPKGTLAKMSISFPRNLDTQKRIISILKSLDDKIEVNRRINDNLEQQAQALFKSWFVDFEPFKNGEFLESEMGMIPKGWRVGCLDELCSFISRGLTPKYDETSEELILGQTCVRNNIVTLNNARKHRPKTKNEKWVQQWDVLLNSTGVGSLGRVGVVYFNMDNVAIDSHITVVRTSCPLYRHYVGRNLLSRQLEIENMAVGSTGQTELPRDRVKAMPIIIPSDDAMDKFNASIEPMAILMYSNIMESRRLAELRDTLLPRLMSGELKVNDVEKEIS